MDPPRAEDATVEKEELDFDAEFKQFEYDMHVGDVDAYTDEIMTVIRIGLECILISTTDSGQGDQTVPLIGEFYEKDDTEQLYDRVVPVFNLPAASTDPDAIADRKKIVGGWAKGVHDRISIQRSHRNDFGLVPRVFQKRDREFVMSACSQFVYRHVVTSATAPFSKKVRHPSHREVAALLSSLNPFPLREGTAKDFIKKVLDKCRDSIRALLADDRSYHLVQHMEDTRPSDLRQPFSPILVTFSRTRLAGNKLKWSVGSETTWVLEGMVLALNLIDVIGNIQMDADRARGNPAKYPVVAPVPAEEVDIGLVPPMVLDPSEESIVTKNDALRRIAIDPGQSRVRTNRFMRVQRNYVYSSQEYANWLHIKGDTHASQAGRYYMGSTDGKKKPVGVFSNIGTRANIMEDFVYFGTIRTMRSFGAQDAYRNDLQLAIDAASQPHLFDNFGKGLNGANPNDQIEPMVDLIREGVYKDGTYTKLWEDGDANVNAAPKMATMLSMVGLVSTYGVWLDKLGHPNGTEINRQAGVKTVGEYLGEMDTHLLGGHWTIAATERYGAALTPGVDKPNGAHTYYTQVGPVAEAIFDTVTNGAATIKSYEEFRSIVSRVIRHVAQTLELRVFSKIDGFPVVGGGYAYQSIPKDLPITGIVPINNTLYTTRPTAEYVEDYDPVNYDDAYSLQLARMAEDGKNLEYIFDASINGTATAENHHYNKGQNIAIPLWEANDAFAPRRNCIGYVVFDKLNVWVNGRQCNHRWYTSSVRDVVILDSSVMDKAGDVDTRVVYSIGTNAVCGLLKTPHNPDDNDIVPLLHFAKHTPMWFLTMRDSTILEDTAHLDLDRAEEKLPYDFNVVQFPPPKQVRVGASDVRGDHKLPQDDPANYDGAGLSVDQVSDILMSSFDGLHFSNSRSLHRTVLAMATGENHAKIKGFLERTIRTYSKPLPWAVSIYNRDSADAVLLSMLYSNYESSSTRSSDMPMAERVLVRCKGPGDADQPTPCYVDGHFYRADLFFRIEVKAMEIFREIVVQHARRDPMGSVPGNIAGRFGAMENIHDMIKYKRKAVPAMAKFMINLYEFEKIGQRSGRPRDKASVRIQSETIKIDALYILYRIA